MSDLRTQLQKLASRKPELREVLRPILTMRTANAKKDLRWAAGEIENALQMLEDVAEVLDGGDPSLADEFPGAAATATYLRKDLSRNLDKHQKALRKLSQ